MLTLSRQSVEGKKGRKKKINYQVKLNLVSILKKRTFWSKTWEEFKLTLHKSFFFFQL